MTSDQMRDLLDPCPDTGELFADNARRYIPTTQCFDLRFTGARGSFVYATDRAGKRYMLVDLGSRVGSANKGHRDPELEELARKFIKKYGYKDPVPHHDAPNEYAVAFARDLVSLMPKEHEWQCFFTLSGTEAMEAALKTCSHYRFNRPDGNRRKKIIAFDGAFHGRTLGALSFNNYALHRKGFDVAYPGRRVEWLPYPACHPYFSRSSKRRLDYSCASPDAYWFEKLHSIDPEEVSALVVEDGVQGEGGMNVRNQEIFRKVFAWCRANRILVVLDGVQSGMGRTGKMFAFMRDGFVPDVLMLGKSLCDGLPQGAILCKKELAPQEKGKQSSTNGGSPLACVIGRAQLKLFEERGALLRIEGTAKNILQPALADIAAKFDVVHSVRNLGFMGGIEFWNPKTRRADPELRDRVVQYGISRGVLLYSCGLSGFRIMPPLTISSELLSLSMSWVGEAIRDACNARARQKRSS